MDDQARYLDAMRRFSGDPRMVAQVFASLNERGVTPTGEHWQLLLEAYVSAGDVDAAEKTLSQMTHAGITVSDEQLFDLGVTFARRGAIQRAITQFDALHQRGARPGQKHAPAVFNAFVTAKRFPAARAVLRDMHQRGETVPKASYLPLLHDALNRRGVKDTEALLASMLASGHAPDSRLASDLVLMVCKAAGPSRAFALVTQLLDANVTLHAGVYATVLRSFVDANDPADIERVIATLLQHNIALTSYAHNARLGARLAAGDLDGAWIALCTLWDAGMLATGEHAGALVAASITAKKHVRALAGVSAMLLTATPVTSDQMQAAVSAAISAKDVDGAIALVRDALYANVALDRRVLRDITQALLAQNRLRHAVILLGDARHAGVVSARSYGAVVLHVLQQKNTARALNLIAYLTNNRIRLNAADASQVLRALARDASREQVLTAVTAFASQKVYADEPTYRELLWDCARAGDTAATRQVYDMMGAAGIAREDSHEKALAWATGATARRLDTPVEIAAPAPSDTTSDTPADATSNDTPLQSAPPDVTVPPETQPGATLDSDDPAAP